MDNAEMARVILTSAIKLNVSVLHAKELFIALADEEPVLTDDECKAIAVNYPFSYSDIRGWFKIKLISMGDEFLEQLAILCEDHKAAIFYTNDDDGVHIEIDGEEIFSGFLFEDNAANRLRLAKT